MKETRLNMSMPSDGSKPSNPKKSSAVRRDPHSTTDIQEGRWSTRRIAIYALFVALSIVASFIELPLFPAAPYLKYDPSGIVSLISGFAFGPMAAVLVSILSWVPHLFTDPYGALMAVAVALSLSVPASLVYRRVHTRKGALLGIIVGSICALAVAIIGNLIITPLYANISVADVAKMILPILLPFNLLKLAIHGIVTFLIYKPISMLVHR
ncbi:ECF transporter S component [Bifidobacterium sp.]|jgi:riboflavin transporter FmnP|uniref:ECF transporter S component n=1 Tax=Bifidobacterium sp. TaxID=41200 RepID=UPI003DAA23D8|nr:ECF transporter S component [Bifidobacterium sp.]